MLKENKKILLPIMILVILILLVGIISAVSSSINIDVINTRDLKVDFVPIDEKSSIFDGTVANNTEFIRSTFPLAGERLITGTNYEILSSSFGLVLEDDEKFRLLKDVYKKGRLSRSTDRVVGIVPDGWFSAHGQGDLKGYTSFGKIFGIAYGTKSVIIEESYMHGVAHEIGHTFGLCDEYSTTEWNIQNNLFGGCPNGDSNNDNELDSICLEYPTGCPVSTFGELVPWNSTNDTINLFNLMGSSNEEKARWISKDSYTHLLDLLSSSLDFLSVDFGVLMSGTVDKEGNVDIDDYSYVLNEKSILNESSEGNYTIFIEENGSILHKMSFEPQFYIMNIGGNLTEVNVSAFSFVLPFSDNVTRIYVEKNNITKDEIIRTPNTPSLQITTDLSDQIFSDEFNVIWDSSDLDEDELVYAVLFSADNGSTFSTLEIDYNKTNITLDPSKLQDCSLCGIKILATDGINTNSSISEAFGIDTTPPNITSIIVFNESDVVDGDVLRGDNITFNVTVTDEGIGIESVWVKIWEESIGISSVIWQGFLSFVSGDLWSVEIETDESFPIGDVNYTVYANDSVGNEMNVSDNFIIIPPIVDISILYPITDISVSQNQFFNVTVNVTCVQGNCGNINATLDPIPENEMTIELTNKRTYNQKAFNIEGNKIRYQIHAGHIHYKESDEFKDIDTSLVLTDSGWEMNKASYSVEIPEFSKGNFKFVNNYEDNKGDIVSMNPIVVNNVKGVLDEDNSVVYEDAFGTGIDLKVIAKNGGLDKLIVINEKPENLTGDLEFKYEIEMNSFDVKSENGLWDKSEVVLTGDTIVLDKTGETYFREFRLWDNSGKSSKVQVRLENVGDKYYLTKILAKGFLEEAIYPVVTDDTISYYSGSGDGHVYNYGDDWDTVHDASSGSSYDYTFSTAGAMDYYFEGDYYIYRSFVPIDTSGIDDNAVIDTASLYLYGDTIYSDLYPCDLHLVQTSQSSSSSLYYDDFNQIGSTEGTPAVDIGSLYTSSYNQFDLNSTGKAWIDKSGYTKFGLRTYYDFNDIDPDDGYQEGYCWFHYKTSEESGTDNDPYLEVDIDYINKGIIPFTIGDIPFYTNETNPRETASLSAGQSEVIIYWVNATGPVESYLFFAFANLTNEMSVGDMSEEWFVDIV